MKIALTGASGLIGQSLLHNLMGREFQFHKMVRKKPVHPESIYWNPVRGEINASQLEGIHTVIHLAGENVGSGRWTERKKKAIYNSRIHSTKFLVQTIKKLKTPPKTFISASATGIYGNQGERDLTENDPDGSGFLAYVCRDWESTSDALKSEGIRVVHMRFGVVLSPAGGALKKMLLPFKMGVGGKIGSGQQYMSWISLSEIPEVFRWVLTNKNIEGPVNVVSPTPVTNLEFTKTLGAVLKRPTIFPMPAVAANLVFGEMAKELLLSSQKVSPKKLVNSGYSFQHPVLKSALGALLIKN